EERGGMGVGGVGGGRGGGHCRGRRGGGGSRRFGRRRGRLLSDRRVHRGTQHQQHCQCENESLHGQSSLSFSAEPASPQSALSSRSPVRMRTADSTGGTKNLPSPLLPVLAAEDVSL